MSRTAGFQKSEDYEQKSEDYEEKTVFLVWSGLRGRSETHSLRAVDTTRQMAEVHANMCEHELEMRDNPGKVWIEETVTNHLYGYTLWDKLESITRQRGAKDA